MMNRKIFLTVPITLMLIGLTWAGTFAAPFADLAFGDGAIELWGVIQEVGADSLVVNGLTVTVYETTEIKDGAEHLELVDLEVDWTIKVEGFLLEDGTIMAEEIEVISREPATPSPSTTPTQTVTLTVTPTVTQTVTLTVTPTVTPTVTITPTLTPTPTVTPTPEEPHPVGLALATFFDVPYDEIMDWHEDGIGFGNIVKAYFVVDLLGDEELTVEHVLDEKLSGTGWGQVMKALGLSPSSKDKSLGEVMSGHGDDDDDDEPEDVFAATENDGASAEGGDDHPGKGHGPPYKDKDKDKTPPGHAKEGKEKGKGKGKGDR